MGRTCKGIMKQIILEHPDITIKKSKTDSSYTENGVIYLAEDDYEPSTMVDVFNLLHEIGHVYTSESWMSRAEREWRATTWAIFHMKKYGVKIPNWRKDNFQDDIYFWYNFEKALTGKKIRMSKSQLKLFWRD